MSLLQFVLFLDVSRTSRNQKVSEYDITQNLVTVMPVKSDSDAMFGLQSYQGLTTDTSLVY